MAVWLSRRNWFFSPVRCGALENPFGVLVLGVLRGLRGGGEFRGGLSVVGGFGVVGEYRGESRETHLYLGEGVT